MSAAAGRAAKRFVDELVHAGDEVVISTTKPDKYDRYLADVFVGQVKGVAGLVEPGRSKADRSTGVSDPGYKATPATAPREAPIFLNNALLENGHAVRYDGVGPKAGSGS